MVFNAKPTGAEVNRVFSVARHWVTICPRALPKANGDGRVFGAK